VAEGGQPRVAIELERERLTGDELDGHLVHGLDGGGAGAAGEHGHLAEHGARREAADPLFLPVDEFVHVAGAGRAQIRGIAAFPLGHDALPGRIDAGLEPAAAVEELLQLRTERSRAGVAIFPA
jgi:hypothetical protein